MALTLRRSAAFGDLLVMRIVFAVIAAASLAGCATVTRGSTSQVTVNTEPAGAAVRTSMNHSCPSSPCTFTVGRKDEFVVTASKPGYREASMPVKTRVAGSGAAGFAGNIVAGGIIGMGVDAATGATLEHYPNPIVLALHAETPASPTAPGPRRKRTPASKPTASKPVAQAETKPAS